ncbi:MAG TPA: hypothetical protein VHZ96_19315 [Frankiaceae bacterium]|jgi:hypothetical protein|nr:hypothetical protein [Frankiaceae bacterium]
MRELPIACTLDAQDAQRRLAQWRSVGEHTLLAVDLAERILTVGYEPSALPELRALVRAEQTCCAFLDWSLEERPDRVLLTIRCDASGEPELSRLAGLLAASG